MKKLLTVLFLSLLIIFTGCDDKSSSSDSAQTEEAANELAPKAMTAAAAAMSSAMSSSMGSGTSSGISNSRTAYTYQIDSTMVSGFDGTSVSGSLTIDTDTGAISGILNINFNDYVSDDVTINGSYTYEFSGNYTSEDFNGTLKGDLTIVYDGESYDMEMDFTYSQSGTDFNVTGSVTCDGEEYEITA